MAVDRQLGHTPVKLRGVAGTYNRQEFLPARRRILAAWGEYVSRRPAPVIDIRSAARSGKAKRQKYQAMRGKQTV
jgi:hypothetical protein